MEKNNWRSGGQILDESAAQGGMDGGGDWRSQLQPDSRQRIVNKIMDTLKRHLPLSGQEGLQELQKIAVRFEEKIHMAATSQSDYLRKISLKMLAMENKSHNSMPNTTSTIPQDPASQTMHSQLQTLPIPMSSNQPQVRQQLLSQNIINNSPSTGAPNSSSLSSGLGLPPGGMPNVAGHNPNMPNTQEVSNMAPNSLGNSVGQGVPSNMFASSQRQITGRQQQVVRPEQQQYMYNQQVQHQLMKQKVQQGSMSHSLMQSQIQQQQQQQQPQQQQQQQQNLLQATQLQSSQHAVMQPSLRQSSVSSTLQQNQHSSLQQSTQSMLQQQSQSVLRQQPQQPSVMHQQQVLPTQQQHLSGQQQNTENMQHNQLIGQQNNILDAQRQQQQQQRLMAQQNSISNLQQQQQQPSIQQNNLPDMHQQQSTGSQNNFPNTHQQQLGLQNNVSGFQQQQMVGTQHVNPGLQNNQPPVMLQQPKITAQQQMQQNRANMLPGQAQQSQSRLPQQQLMSQIQSQPGQMQQQVGLQQAPNPIQRDMQQRIQTPGSLLQQQLTVDQPKQLLQSQGVLSEMPLDSSSNSGNANSGDWQEEVYQKIKSMSEMYFSELNEMYQRMTSKLQQHDSLPQQPKNEQLEKLRFFKVLLERLMIFLRTNKNEIQPNHKEKMLAVEKQILSIINSNKPRKPVSSLQQGQVAQSQMHTMQQSQQLQRQVSPMNNNENQMSSQMQPMNVQGSQIQNNLTNLQPNSISSLSNVSNSRQNMMDAMHPNSNIDPGHGNAMNSIRQVAMSSIQQNPVGGPQQMNSSSISSQGGLTSLQSNVNPVQASTNLLQSQHVKQEQPMFTTQQMKQQYQQRHMQQQHIHRQQLMQQQHQQHHMTPQNSSQLPAQQMVMNDTDMKMRSQISGKPGVLQQHHSSGQRPSYQQMKTGPPFSISSPQVLQASSPQFGHHPSPQLDHQNMLISHAKGGTPLQSANSPFIVPSPSTSMAPSPMPGDSEKINSGISSLVNAGNNVHHSSTGASMSAQSMAIGTPGISASPLLAEFTSPEGTHGIASTIVSGNPKVAEEPLERLTKVVKSMTPKALSAAVSDISSVVSMVDRIAGSAPGNGSRAAVGEDLVAMTKCRLQARNFFTQDGSGGSKKMRRYTSAVPSTVVSSTGSVDDSPWHLNGFESDGESTGASSIKKPRIEANHALEEELRELNQRLIDTIVHISEDDIDPTAVTAATEGGDGTIVKCTFTAVALSPNLKSHYASAQMSPIQPLRLLIPSNYPKCSPILLDKFPVEVSKEYEDLSLKAKSRLSISLRSLSEPMSLGEIAKTWDVCARAVILEYAQQRGGGSFSSKYGTWENCLSAA